MRYVKFILTILFFAFFLLDLVEADETNVPKDLETIDYLKIDRVNDVKTEIHKPDLEKSLQKLKSKDEFNIDNIHKPEDLYKLDKTDEVKAKISKPDIEEVIQSPRNKEETNIDRVQKSVNLDISEDLKVIQDSNSK